ncbi:MAG TPA: S8 family serine peptidase [Gemmatimonadales bacterium]|nr:S8 family serine peptidase [Gemmatimonadales bacterium]
MTRRLILSLAAILAIGACSDQEDRSTTGPETPSEASSRSPRKYVISFSRQTAIDIEASIKTAGGKVRRASKAAGVATASSSDPAFADRLKAAPGIVSVTEDLVVQWIPPSERAIPASIGDDEGFFNPYQWAPKSIHAEEAWDLGARGRGVRVAVLDGGLNNNHQDLDANVDVRRSASMVDGFLFNQDQDPDGFSHATHVAGIVAAENNNSAAPNGTIGIAPNATIVGVKVLHQGSGSFGDIIDGIIYAAQPINQGGAGVHIINMSLGATFSSGEDTRVLALKAVMDQATTYAHEQGVVVIASAGNGDRQGRGIDHDSGNWFTLPAQSEHVLGVSATGPEGFATGATNFTRLASYSNFGTQIVDFAGPGGDFTLFPDPNYVFDMVLSPGTLYPATAGYFFAAGTSMSAPAVAGVAALIVEEMGGAKNPVAVEAKLRSSSDDLGASGLDPVYGHGFVNAEKAVQ